MGYLDYERELARCTGFDIGFERGFILTMKGIFEYEGGGQGLGYFIDDDFIKRFMQVFSIESLQDVNGKECWVTHNHANIKLVEPLFKKDGKPFDIELWSEKINK